MNKDLHKYSDAELLSFYRRTRKPDYLIGLYERYMPLVYGVTLKYLKNVPDAQDAVMQIWEELFEKVLHHDIQVFKAWLYSCVRNYCLMELRRRSGNNFVGLDEKFMEFCDDFNLEYSRETDRQGHYRSVWKLCLRNNGFAFVIFLWMNCLIKKSGKLRVLL
mgnify:FL=1